MAGYSPYGHTELDITEVTKYARIHTTEDNLAIKKEWTNDIHHKTTTQMNLKIIMLSERSQIPSPKKKKRTHSMWFYLPRTVEKSKLIDSDKKQISSCVAEDEDREEKKGEITMQN